MFVKKSLGFALTLVLLLSFVALPVAAQGPAPAKSIILLIGDGMGINQVRVTDLYAREAFGTELIFDSIETRGATTTHSADSEVTDSAAAASAIYSGFKFNSGAINVLPDGRNAFTIAQAAQKAGKAVGGVSTTRITHATPASLWGHTPDRDDENLIAEQMVGFEPEVAMGGGWRHFVPQSEDGSKRKDDRNLIEEMQAKGYVYVTNADELEAVDPETTDKLLGLFFKSHMSYEIDRVTAPELGSQPSIAEMTDVAIKILEKDPDGFFLMVEGGRIDHACHAHDVKGTIQDTLAFDEAIKVALDYQKAHPDVLVIITGDHETGGLGLGIGTEYFTDIPVLESVNCSMEYLNEQINKDPAQTEEIVETCFGFKLTDEEKEALFKFAPESGMDDIDDASIQAIQAMPGFTGYVWSWAHFILCNLESERARIGWTSWAHTGQPVITYAVGPGEEMFEGFFDNTDIARRMAALLGVTLEEPY